LLNVKEVTAPWLAPSTVTLETTNPELGVMVNDWLAPEFTVTVPEGLIEPLLPALAVMVNVMGVNAALMVWSAVTLLNVKEVTAPWLAPSTVTLETTNPELGVMVNDWLAPEFTTILPDGLIDPLLPALAVMVCVVTVAWKAALMV